MGWRAKLLGQAEDEVRPVIEKRLAAGAVLFRAGEPCPGVALIHDGAVELLDDVAGVNLRIGTRGRGAFVGDDAVLGTGICRHTVVALRQTMIEMLDRDIFLERFASGRHSAFAASIAPLLQPREAAGAARVVQLAAASPESQAAMPSGSIEIRLLPFVVGRAPTGPGQALDRGRALLLEERPPFRLSRRQFAIVATEAGVGLSDPGSRLGTFVDGERLGMAPVLVAPGRTIEVIAGGAQSPFRFHLSAAP
jgi:hypothetical protein